jgi:hypothetical protein
MPSSKSFKVRNSEVHRKDCGSFVTDRGDPPRGNTVNRATMDAASGKRKEPEIPFNHLMEGIACP